MTTTRPAPDISPHAGDGRTVSAAPPSKLRLGLFVATVLGIGWLGPACGTDATSTADSSDSAASDSVSTQNVATVAAPFDVGPTNDLRLPDGWFEMSGYGTVLHVDNDTITLHSVTASTCTVADDIDNELVVDHATNDGGVIVLDLVGPTTDYRVLPLTDGLDCVEADSASTSASLVALDELFTAHYPFFVERDVDWPTERALLDAAGDDLEPVLHDFFVRLGDGHTTTDDVDIDPDIAAFGLDGVTTIDDLGSAISDELDTTINRVTEVQADASGAIAWGQWADDVGYLTIVAFEGIGGDDDPAADLEALRAGLDEAIADLDTRFDQLIVDVRFNGGGYEDLAVAAAGYFVDEATPAYRKWAYAQPDPFGQTVDVEPQSARFRGDVVVVTSPMTASAAEVFTLAMVEVADASVVGARSFGEFSDALDWVLPNGIEFTVSMEVYTDLEGNGFEARGVPVDVPAAFDQSIDAAARHLLDSAP